MESTFYLIVKVSFSVLIGGSYIIKESVIDFVEFVCLLLVRHFFYSITYVISLIKIIRLFQVNLIHV